MISNIQCQAYICTFVVSRAFMAGAASQAGDADSYRAPGLTSGLQGSVNVHSNVKYKRTDALSLWHQQKSTTVEIHGPLQTRGEKYYCIFIQQNVSFNNFTDMKLTHRNNTKTLHEKFDYTFLNVCRFDRSTVAGSEKFGPLNENNYTSRVALLIPTDQFKSVRKRCAIELFSCGYCCRLRISVSIGPFVIQINQMPSFFPFHLYLKLRENIVVKDRGMFGKNFGFTSIGLG